MDLLPESNKVWLTKIRCTKKAGTSTRQISKMEQRESSATRWLWTCGDEGPGCATYV